MPGEHWRQYWCGVLCVVLTASAQTAKVPALVRHPARHNVDIRFQEPYALPAGTAGPLSTLLSGDWDGDGKTDLAVTAGKEVRIFQGDGQGGFRPSGALLLEQPSDQAVAADLNGDGRTDIVVFHPKSEGDPPQTADEILSLLSQGDWRFSSPLRFRPPAIGGFPPYLLGFVMADLNLDGKPDLLLTRNGVGSDSVSLGRGDGTFASPIPGGPLTFMLGGVADFNSDGVPDVLIDGIGGVPAPRIYYGRGDGTFDIPVAIDACQPVAGCFLRVIDADGDGKPDLLAGNSSWGWAGNIHILRGDGHGGFAAGAQLPDLNASDADQAFYIHSFVDLNADGIPELIRTSECCAGPGGESTSLVSVYPGLGGGEFGRPVQMPLPNQAAAAYMRFIDVDGDGRPDLVTSDGSQNLLIYLNISGR